MYSSTFKGHKEERERLSRKIERIERLRLHRVPYELVSSAWLYKWFLVAEKEIRHMKDTRFDLVELAADVHLAYQRKNYVEFKTLLLEFIKGGRY
jgi:hypothetical protein